MTLKEKPTEFEHEGYRWVSTSGYSYSCDRDQMTLTYVRKEKLYVPPTMKEIMEHLVNGGWIKFTYDGESGCVIYVRLKADGKGTESLNIDELYLDWQESSVFELFSKCAGRKELFWPPKSKRS